MPFSCFWHLVEAFEKRRFGLKMLLSLSTPLSPPPPPPSKRSPISRYRFMGVIRRPLAPSYPPLTYLISATSISSLALSRSPFSHRWPPLTALKPSWLLASTFPRPNFERWRHRTPHWVPWPSIWGTLRVRKRLNVFLRCWRMKMRKHGSLVCFRLWKSWLCGRAILPLIPRCISEWFIRGVAVVGGSIGCWGFPFIFISLEGNMGCVVILRLVVLVLVVVCSWMRSWRWCVLVKSWEEWIFIWRMWNWMKGFMRFHDRCFFWVFMYPCYFQCCVGPTIMKTW